MPTFATLIDEAELRSRAARRDAEIARATSKTAPADAGLRFEAQLRPMLLLMLAGKLPGGGSSRLWISGSMIVLLVL